VSIEIHWQPAGALELFKSNLAAAPTWMPQIISDRAHDLGPLAIRVMQEEVRANLYTGALIDSISADYENNDSLVTVAPRAMRGKWDAGLILEFGTRPIPNAPWKPIAAWADFKGIPAAPVVIKIRTQGVSAHPFLDRTLDDFMPYLDDAAETALNEMLEHIFEGL